MRTYNSWYTACKNLEQNCRPLYESMERGHPHQRMYLLARILVVRSGVNSVAVTVNISALFRSRREAISTSSWSPIVLVVRPPATLLVRGRFLMGGLPYYRDCVSSNCFESRISWLHSQAVQRCGSGFWWAASSTHGLVSGTGLSPNFSYFCMCGLSGWVGVKVQPLKAGHNPRNR